MSWLSDHLFGKPKDTSSEGNAAPVPLPMAQTPAEMAASAANTPVSGEIQSDTVTTSKPTSGDDMTTIAAYENREVAAEWQIPVRGRLHKVEFEHGTTSGRRILWIDEKVRFHVNGIFGHFDEFVFLFKYSGNIPPRLDVQIGWR